MALAAQPATDPAPAAGRSKLVKYLGAFVLGGAVLAVVIALVSLTLARFDAIEKIAGFIGFMMLLNPARALVVVGIVTLVIGFATKAQPLWQAALGTVLAGGLLAAMYFAVILPAGNVPPMHDITTDVDDPPQFTTLPLREDNLVPFASEEEWRAMHRQNYGDIGPIVIQAAPDVVLARARAVAEDKGWEIAAYDAAAGHMEATATAGYLRFYDDVIVEVTAIEDGSTRVDMRSVSRVGVSDIGYNAARIRDFLAALQNAG